MRKIQKKAASFFIGLCLYGTGALASKFEDGTGPLAEKSRVDSGYDSPALGDPGNEGRDTRQALEGSYFESLSDELIVRIFQQKGASRFYGVCSHFTNILRNSKGILPNIVFRSPRIGGHFDNKDLSVLANFKNVHTLNLAHTPVINVSMLGGVHTLDLRDTRVTDVSMLGGVHTLELSGTQVTDVSQLGGIHTLNLSFTHVTDVSQLGGVHILRLGRTHVTDVSQLGRVHALYLWGTPVTDVSQLGGVHTLDLCDTPVTDVSQLGGVHTLDLRDTRVTDVSMLSRVHTLDLCDTPVTDENIARLKAINPNVFIYK